MLGATAGVHQVKSLKADTFLVYFQGFDSTSDDNWRPPSKSRFE